MSEGWELGARKTNHAISVLELSVPPTLTLGKRERLEFSHYGPMI